jgi:hypothetical protein
MSTETLVSVLVIAVRLAVPLSIVRWPLAGAIASIIADTFDHSFLQRYGFGLFEGDAYQHLDKLLDTWYLCFLALAIARWANPLARRVGYFLFGWRVIGFLAFEFTGVRQFLVFFPNALENFFLLWVVITKFSPDFALTRRRLVMLLTVAVIPKVYTEAMMHWVYPDQAHSWLIPWPRLRAWYAVYNPWSYFIEPLLIK